jgi:hypothetical protein
VLPALGSSPRRRVAHLAPPRSPTGKAKCGERGLGLAPGGEGFARAASEAAYAEHVVIERLNTTFFLTAGNVFGRLHIAGRSRGILPGQPRLVQGALKFNFRI